MANSYREETAARASHREETAGRGAVAERLAGAPLLHHREEPKKHQEASLGTLDEEGEEDSILFCNFGGKM